MRLSNLTFSLLLLFLSCSSAKVVNFVNDSINFSKYSSFAVINFNSNDANISQEGLKVLREIESTIDEQMLRREYTYSGKKPDVIIRYEIIANQTTSNNSSNYYNGMYGPGMFNPGMYNPGMFNYGFSPFSMFPGGYSYRSILKSALLVEMYDLETKKLIWQASTDLVQYNKSNKQQQILRDAINKIFDTYLYRANSNEQDQSLITTPK